MLMRSRNFWLTPLRVRRNRSKLCCPDGDGHYDPKITRSIASVSSTIIIES